MKRRRKSRGLGAVNPDASAAIRAARTGHCSSAMKYLYDASPDIQSKNPTPKHIQDHRIASMIVSKLCVRGDVKGKPGRYKGRGFEGRKRR
jgi:hypothetical protein